MNINIHLNKEQTDKLLAIYSMVNDPEITCIEDYVETLLDDLLSKIWDNVRHEILN